MMLVAEEPYLYLMLTTTPSPLMLLCNCLA